MAISLGSRVRVVDREALHAFARARVPDRPLEPAQFLCAGRAARVVSVRRGPDRRDRYALEGLPGLWHPDCLRPA